MLKLAADEAYTFRVYDPMTGLVASTMGIAPKNNVAVDLTTGLVFHASTAPDADGNGVPDDIQDIIGKAYLFDFGTDSSRGGAGLQAGHSRYCLRQESRLRVRRPGPHRDGRGRWERLGLELVDRRRRHALSWLHSA